MIKLTVKQLLDVSSSRYMNDFFTLDKPMDVAWKNRRQIATCNEELKLYDEKRIALCQKYGKKNDATNNYEFYKVDEHGRSVLDPNGRPVIDEAAKQSFEQELRSLWAQEVCLPGEPVSIKALVAHASTTPLKTSLKGPELPLFSESAMVLLEPFLTD